MNAFTTWLWQHWHLWGVTLLIAGVVLHYVARFAAPASRLRQTLAVVIEQLSALKAIAAEKGVELAQIDAVMLPEPRLRHLWQQYAKGLHPQWVDLAAQPAVQAQSRSQALSEAFFAAMKAKTGTAVVNLSHIEQLVMDDPRLASLWAEYSESILSLPVPPSDQTTRVKQWRSSALAETYFSEHALVDSPLQSDFYKHVPGILTGLGIIGTFSGLIMGLVHFDVSNPESAQLQLSLLVQTVGQAFWVSAAAITLAMLLTWVEKSLLTARYAQVEEVQHLIDSLFEASSGEAYLERLVAAAQAQTAATNDLLQALRQTVQALSAK